MLLNIIHLLTGVRVNSKITEAKKNKISDNIQILKMFKKNVRGMNLLKNV
jgi:hypothetical protein